MSIIEHMNRKVIATLTVMTLAIASLGTDAEAQSTRRHNGWHDNGSSSQTTEPREQFEKEQRQKEESFACGEAARRAKEQPAQPAGNAKEAETSTPTTAHGSYDAVLQHGQSTEWTAEEIDSADLARNVAKVDDMDKDVVLFLNLARLYPQKFARLEVEPYIGEEMYGHMYKGPESKYWNNKQSLLRDLRAMQPVQALRHNALLQYLADEWSYYLGSTGGSGHKRPGEMQTRKDAVRPWGECISYGHFNGREFVLDLLIDGGVASLGHRKIILNGSYNAVGASTNGHKKWQTCCVIDFSLTN